MRITLKSNPELAAQMLRTGANDLPTMSRRMAMIVLFTGPLMEVFTFIHHFFIEG